MPTDTDFQSKSAGSGQNAVCELLDMGAYYMADFVESHGRPIEGSAVHGGIHVLQIMPLMLMGRLLFNPRMSQTNQVLLSACDYANKACPCSLVLMPKHNSLLLSQPVIIIDKDSTGGSMPGADNSNLGSSQLAHSLPAQH